MISILDLLPIRDHNPSGKSPILTYFLTALNVFVFFYMYFLPKDRLENFIFSFALIPSFVIAGKNLFSFFASMFLHGSFGHIFSNMLFLNLFGDNLEVKLGKIRYLIFYFLSGIGASICEILVNPTSEIPIFGASGAIAGLMGGYLFLFPNNQIDMGYDIGFLRKDTVPAWSVLFYWFFFQLISGLGSLGFPQLGGIAYFAHIGGFLTGLGTIFFWKKSKAIR